MFQFIHRNDLLAFHGGKDRIYLNIIAMANVGRCFFLGGHLMPYERFRVAVFQYEACHVEQCFALDVKSLHTSHMRLILATGNLFDNTFANILSSIINQVNLGIFLSIVLEGQIQQILGHIVAKQCQAGTVVNALHTADTLGVVNLRHAAGSQFGNGALRTGERARIAGKTVEAVGHHERFSQSFGCWAIGFI